MEEGLVRNSYPITGLPRLVLILVVVEDGLVHIK